MKPFWGIVPVFAPVFFTVLVGAVAATILMLIGAGCSTLPKKDRNMVQGFVASGYEEVRDEFEINLRHRGELGGAFAAYVDGELVVDLWGGWADPKRTRPWEKHSSVVVFSATKGVGAMTLAHLHSKGLLDYNRRVSEYWPKFPANGKAAITVRQLLSHQAGIVLSTEPLDARNPEGAARNLADTAPLWTPGDYHGYHAGTVGFARRALVLRIDPLGRSINSYLQEELAGPLDADFTIGLTPGYERKRIAVIKPFSPMEAMFHLREMPKKLRKVVFNRNSLFWKSMGEGKVDMNSSEFISRENPSGNGIGTARGMAALYGELASGGRRIGLTPETLAEVFGPAERPRLDRLDRVMNLDSYYGLGFQKPNPTDGWFSENSTAIGFPGASGAIGVADQMYRVGFAYVTNRMSPGNQVNDPRERALQGALYRALRIKAEGGLR
jgi:CubicO group peptidase (beta-lactamase class C family)